MGHVRRAEKRKVNVLEFKSLRGFVGVSRIYLVIGMRKYVEELVSKGSWRVKRIKIVEIVWTRGEN